VETTRVVQALVAVTAPAVGAMVKGEGDGHPLAFGLTQELELVRFAARIRDAGAQRQIGAAADPQTGLAVALDGGLIVPVVKNVQVKTLEQIAVESADVTLVKGDLRAIAKAARLSRATMRNIRQNLFFAFVYNVIGIPVAAGVLYPRFGILLSPVIAAAAMSFSSVSVVTNALRLRRTRL